MPTAGLAKHFTAEETECLIRTAAELYASAGDPDDVLSTYQRDLAQRAHELMSDG